LECAKRVVLAEIVKNVIQGFVLMILMGTIAKETLVMKLLA
jgi:hypothetical protein